MLELMDEWQTKGADMRDELTLANLLMAGVLVVLVWAKLDGWG